MTIGLNEASWLSEVTNQLTHGLTVRMFTFKFYGVPNNYLNMIAIKSEFAKLEALDK
jgi:hypothetical protein